MDYTEVYNMIKEKALLFGANIEQIESEESLYYDESGNVKLRVDLPTLQAIAIRTWGKEDELKVLKSELAALDRKITAELAPKHDEKDGEEVKHDDQTQHVNRADAPSQSIGTKDSMVAEPQHRYQSSPQTIRSAYRPPGL